MEKTVEEHTLQVLAKDNSSNPDWEVYRDEDNNIGLRSGEQEVFHSIDDWLELDEKYTLYGKDSIELQSAIRDEMIKQNELHEREFRERVEEEVKVQDIDYQAEVVRYQKILADYKSMINHKITLCENRAEAALHEDNSLGCIVYQKVLIEMSKLRDWINSL